MEEKIDLNPYGHSPYPITKYLKLIKEENNIGEYTMFSDSYLRYSVNPDNSINFIDFDGGPLLTVGTNLGKYSVCGFTTHEDSNLIYVLIKKN